MPSSHVRHAGSFIDSPTILRDVSESVAEAHAEGEERQGGLEQIVV